MLKLNLVCPKNIMNLFSPLLFLKVTMFHELIELKEKKKKNLSDPGQNFQEIDKRSKEIGSMF